MPKTTAISGLDHCIIAARDLEIARDTYEKLGFTLSRRGRHIGWGTANYCIMFGPDYLELLGIVDPAQYTPGLENFTEKREGLMKIISRSDNIQTTRDHLLAQGFHPDAVQDLGRALEMPEGDVIPRFKLLHLPEADTPGLSTFICQHLTPELVWRDEWMTHANGAKAVYAYTILYDDPASLAETYGKFYGIAPVVLDGRIVVKTGGGKLIFCTATDLSIVHPGIHWPYEQANGTMPVITIAVDETDKCAKHLNEKSVAHIRREDGSILVQAADAHGVALQFQSVYN